MKTIAQNFLFLVTTSLVLVFLGCSKGGAPEALPPDRAIAEITRAFAKSKPEFQETAKQAVAALQAGHYPEAATLLGQLSRASELSAPEREVATRAMLGVSRLLQGAQAKGDPQSAEYLRRLQKSK